MKETFGIFSADSVNCYGDRFQMSDLERMLNESFEDGNPSTIQHDVHRPVAWSFPYGLFVEPNLTRLAGMTILPEDDEERANLNNFYRSYLITTNNEECSKYIKKLTNLLKNYLTEDYECISIDSVSIKQNNLAKETFPTIFDKKDKDGLIPLNHILKDFKPLFGSAFKSKENDLIVYSHPYFRRSFSRLNYYNAIFLSQLLKLNENNDIKIKIALDEDLIGYAPTFRIPIELEFWWGPKFDENIENIPEGVTIHAADERLKYFHGISKTEFRWREDGEKRIFEAEEIKDINYPSTGFDGDKYGCRYVHTQFDLNKKIFCHLDGAVKIYSKKEMLSRINKTMKSAGKNSDYNKIFRIDGKLSNAIWKNLVSNYFRGNSLIIEYFDEEIAKAKFDEYYECEDKVKTRLHHCLLNDLKGIKLGISYHKLQEKRFNKKRELVIFDVITTPDKKCKYIENDIFELKKLLKKLGDDLEIPKDIKVVEFYDSYLNFPIIRHGWENLSENINNTIKAIHSFVRALKSENIIFSFTLSWPTGLKEVRLSVLGYMNDLVNWLDEFGYDLPLTDEKIPQWLKINNKWLNENYPDSELIKDVTNIFKRTGVILIDRLIIPHERIKNLNFSNEEGLNLTLDIDGMNDKIVSAYLKGKILISSSYIFNESICSKCKSDYTECEHSKYLNNVIQEVKKFKPAFYIFTDKNPEINSLKYKLI